MGTVARALAAAGLALSALPFAATTALAECEALPADLRLDVGYAFVATVTEASTEVDEAVDMAPFDWHVELRVDRVYDGELPDSIAFNGWTNGCFGISGDSLTTGDRLFIASEEFHSEYLPRSPFEGDLVIWRRVNGEWRFDPSAVDEDPANKWGSAALRDATTTPEILRAIQSAPPDTATASFVRDEPRPPLAALVLAFVVAFAATWRRLSRGRLERP